MSKFKRLSALIVAAVLSLALVSCGDDAESKAESKAESAAESVAASTAESEAASEAESEAASDAESEAPSEAESEAASDAESEDESEDAEINGFPAEEVVEWKDYMLHIACGDFTVNALGDIETTSTDNIAVVMDDGFKTGKISATLVANGGEEADNDNGIIFGLEEIPLDYFWEEGRPYYFLFVSDACGLYLAKVAYNDTPWTVIAEISLADHGIIYSHGSPITITAEVAEGGVIKCYADNQLIIEYTDPDPLTGEGYGIRGEWEGVSWQNLTVEKN